MVYTGTIGHGLSYCRNTTPCKLDMYSTVSRVPRPLPSFPSLAVHLTSTGSWGWVRAWGQGYSTVLVSCHILPVASNAPIRLFIAYFNNNPRSLRCIARLLYRDGKFIFLSELMTAFIILQCTRTTLSLLRWSNTSAAYRLAPTIHRIP